MKTKQKLTEAFSDAVFKAVYDLPCRHKWTTRDQDVRKIEKLLDMSPETIGAPLWVSSDQRQGQKYRQGINWLDIGYSALGSVHSREMIAQVILGQQKYFNTEAPRAIARLKCHQCGAKIAKFRSFKYHNWAYAKPALLRVIKEIEQRKVHRNRDRDSQGNFLQKRFCR